MGMTGFDINGLDNLRTLGKTLVTMGWLLQDRWHCLRIERVKLLLTDRFFFLFYMASYKTHVSHLLSTELMEIVS